MFTPTSCGTVDLMTAQALDISGGSNPSRTSSRLSVGKLSRLHVHVANAGASTNVNVTVYGSPSATSTRRTSLATFTLGAAVGATAYEAGAYLRQDAIPSYIYCIATNADAANVANVTVSLDRYR